MSAEPVAGFEAVVRGQRAVAASSYDETYFADGWREHGNRYDLESRRRVEGRHPQLIKDVFGAGRVLDVGCGPGFLMTFLDELGVDVHGIDFSPAATRLAPEAVRERITIGDVTEPFGEERAFDVVISREVLEHLTVLQIRCAVTQMCRASAGFVYVTARFHPSPAHLLDVTSDFETDPTHITLLNKDLLRCLFVLEGFAQRADLEARLDWAGKGRVLVYERCGA
jgi:SAM-dependent methyltransferase